MTKKCSDTELNLLRTPWPMDTPRDDECDGYSQVTVSSPRPGPENGPRLGPSYYSEP